MHQKREITLSPGHESRSQAPLIQVDHLVKRYKRATVDAVSDLSFTVAPGSFFALLGPNGAGKTTTLSILTTTLQPTSGTVRIAGYEVTKQPSAVRRHIGILFQNPSLDRTMTGEEHLRFHATLYGLYPYRPAFALMPRAYKTQIRDLATLLGIEKDLFEPIKKYSGGMKRKLEVLRCLLHQPQVLFLDEPTTGLDPLSRRSLWEYLGRIREEQGMTIFLTTHYLEEAEQADTICIINHGSLISSGTPQQVKAHLIEDYLLVDTDDRPRLREELRRLQIAFSETPLFKINVQTRSAHALLTSITTPLTLIQTHLPTLEEAYLEMLGGDAV